MMAFITEASDNLGFKIKFGADDDLTKLKKGKPLLLRDLRMLPDGSPVYVTYKEYGESGYRINGAMRITKLEENEWDLSDGSSFGANFSAEDTTEDTPCYECPAEQGDMFLYHVLKAK